LLNKGFGVGTSSQMGYDLNSLIDLVGGSSINTSNLLHFETNLEGITLQLDVNSLSVEGISNISSTNLFEFVQKNPFAIDNTLKIGHNNKIN